MLVKNLGSDLEITSASVTRGDAASIELALFTGNQQSAASYKLADGFEMRFACKAQGRRPAKVPPVLAELFTYLPLEQVYAAAPSFNTIPLDALFVQASGYRVKDQAYSLASGDSGLLLAFVVDEQVNLTITDALAVNQSVYVESGGAAAVNIQAASGVNITWSTNIFGTAAALVSGRDVVKLTKTATNAYTAEIPAELDSVTLEGEFSWRNTTPLSGWTSTKIITFTVVNDLIRGNEGAPVNTGEPTIYVTREEIASGFVKTDVAQSLSDEQKARARENIGAMSEGNVVGVVPQTFTAEQKGHARTNIGAASQADLVELEEDLAQKAEAGALTALATVVGGKANLSAMEAADNALDARLDVVESQLSAVAMPRPPTLFLPTGTGTTVHLMGALSTATGTVKARSTALYDAGSTMTNDASVAVFIHATGSTLTVGQPVMLSTTSALPGGFFPWLVYYVVAYESATRKFSLSLTAGGSAISRSSNGSGTQKVHKLYTTGDLRRSRRIGWQSSATAGNACGTRHHAAQWRLANDAVMGRWRYRARFGIADPAAVSEARMFVGLVNRTTLLPNADPSTQLNCIGVGQDSGDSNLWIMHNDGSGAATRFDLGEDFPTGPLNEEIYELEMTANAAGTAVAWRVKRQTTGDVAQGTVNVDLPAAHALLAPQIWRNNGLTAKAVAIDVLWWSMESAV